MFQSKEGQMKAPNRISAAIALLAVGLVSACATKKDVRETRAYIITMHEQQVEAARAICNIEETMNVPDPGGHRLCPTGWPPPNGKTPPPPPPDWPN
jgi:hypothetical protein